MALSRDCGGIDPRAFSDHGSLALTRRRRAVAASGRGGGVGAPRFAAFVSFSLCGIMASRKASADRKSSWASVAMGATR